MYFNDDGTKLILSQEEFIKKSVIKLKGKGLFRGDGSSGTTKGEEDAFVHCRRLDETNPAGEACEDRVGTQVLQSVC